MKRLSMRKTAEIALRLQAGDYLNDFVRLQRVWVWGNPKCRQREYLGRARAAGLGWPLKTLKA